MIIIWGRDKGFFQIEKLIKKRNKNNNDIGEIKNKWQHLKYQTFAKTSFGKKIEIFLLIK